MRIGIGMDDTICRTTEIVHEKLEEYSKKIGLNPLDIMNDEMLKDIFFDTYLEEIYDRAIVKRNVKDVIRRLRNKGNEIYLITARTNISRKEPYNIYSIIQKWLDKSDIEVDAVVSSAYGEEKAEVCKRYDIDLMIDDNPYNYKKITESGRRCLLFDDRGKYELRKDYATNWLDVEKYIERNR